MLDLQIADSTAHIPDDILSLPVCPERLCELVIGSIHDGKRCVVCALEAPFVRRDEGISPFEKIVSILCPRRFVIDLPELAIAFFISEIIDFSLHKK